MINWYDSMPLHVMSEKLITVDPKQCNLGGILVSRFYGPQKC
jgi:hypothetical protein